MTTVPELDNDTSVLIVGGGLTGLSAAVFLAWRGVPTVLVERHAGSSPHPRAIGFTTRTLEMFRAVGLGAKIPQLPAGHGRPRRVAVESLAGRWAPEIAWTPDRDPAGPPRPRADHSPCTGAALAQDRLEPILRDKAIELGADVRLSTELVSFCQDHRGVQAVVRTPDGAESSVRADYAIAADGHRSPIREALGIGRSGHGFMRVIRSVMFRADLDQYLESGISQFELDQPGLKGMLTTYRDGRWLLMTFDDDKEHDDAALRVIVRRAIGRDDVEIELITTGRWELSALIADRFSAGRIFLIGDAAHTLPPARGGYGANTGIEDAFNVAWKLAAVTKGPSTPELLETYDAERRPIAWLRHDQIFARPDYAAVATEEEKRVAILDDDAMELGQLYRSKAVLGADASLPAARRPEQWGGQPGTRAPHLWVCARGEQRSTLDLLQRGWVLVTEDERWCDAAARASKQLGIEVECLHVGGANEDGRTLVSPPTVGAQQRTLDTPIAQIVAEPEGRAVLDANLPTDAEKLRSDFRRAFGIGPEGASLVRPDGYIAWRSVARPNDPAEALTSALRETARLG